MRKEFKATNLLGELPSNFTRFPPKSCHDAKMRKRLRVVVAILTIALLAFFTWMFWPSDEPYYKGKPLSHWLRGYRFVFYAGRRGPMPGYLSTNSLYQANEAVRQLGTNALPTLCKLIETKDSTLGLQTRMFLAGSRFGGFLIQHGYLAPVSPGVFHQIEGFSGLYALRTNAVGAVPTLIKLCDQTNFLEERLQAVRLLGEIGPGAKDAVPALIRVATTPVRAPMAIGWDPSMEARIQACYALMQIRAEPEMSVQAMVRCLHDPEGRIRFVALQCIGLFGKDAQSAVPALVDVIKTNSPPNKNADAELKKDAERVLKQISGEDAAGRN
jgi:hypothetical protein